MAIDLATKYLPATDEIFATESKKSLLTNHDFDWTGAHSIKIYSVTTASINDYDRAGTGENVSRYGPIQGLDATTQEMTLKKDRSFTFAIDTLDADETAMQLAGATALARQQREVVIPEVDTYTLDLMCKGAGNKPAATKLTTANIYTQIITGSAALDNAEAPDSNRVLVVTPDTLLLMKQNSTITMNSDIGAELRKQGVVAMLDGLYVMKVPANRLPKNFGFMIAHPCATVAPTKLEEYLVHKNPPFINGDLVEGRIVYDAFILNNKKKAIYYQENKVEEEPDSPDKGEGDGSGDGA